MPEKKRLKLTPTSPRQLPKQNSIASLFQRFASNSTLGNVNSGKYTVDQDPSVITDLGDDEIQIVTQCPICCQYLNVDNAELNTHIDSCCLRTFN